MPSTVVSCVFVTSQHTPTSYLHTLFLVPFPLTLLQYKYEPEYGYDKYEKYGKYEDKYGYDKVSVDLMLIIKLSEAFSGPTLGVVTTPRS